MVKKVEIKMDHDALCVCGDLDFNNAMSLYEQSLKLFSKATSSITVDLSGLHSTNSVALAVMIGWMRLAKKFDKTVKFKNVSADIVMLAKASGLNAIIDPVLV